ncbi:hypothetical protein ACP70R_014716 [Stipagrostis hirtigluma subsp. patula]
MAASASSKPAAVAGVALLLLALTAVVSAASAPLLEPPATTLPGYRPCASDDTLPCPEPMCGRVCVGGDGDRNLPAGYGRSFTAAGAGEDGETLGTNRCFHCCCRCPEGLRCV